MISLHPLSLILAALCFSSLAILVADPYWLAVIFLLCLLFRGFVSGFQLKLWAHQFIRVLPVLLAVVIIQILLNSNNWQPEGYRIDLAGPGLITGLAISLRLLIVIFSAQLLLSLDYEDFDFAFRALRLPEELCFMVFYVIHVIPSAAGKVRHSLLLLRLRGIQLKKLPLPAKLKIFQRVSLNVIAGLLSGSGIQATALELRGFRSSGPRSVLNHRAFRGSDLLLLLALAGLIILIAIGS
ncbi:MAG: energy-coupling factor transporter transmembrane protein EcfT [Candidatus Cloacimonetes bacterium]|nr:energy-coupling factor transporter transmembrane protein EcfT [Candidatus Cloacimonadota bacterium]